jgi:hypothetical protein
MAVRTPLVLTAFLFSETERHLIFPWKHQQAKRNLNDSIPHF